MLEKLEMIIDPKDSGICAYTNNKEAIVLRLSKSYFTCFDNVTNEMWNEGKKLLGA